MIDTVFGIILGVLSIAHMIATAVIMLKNPDILFGKGEKKDE